MPVFVVSHSTPSELLEDGVYRFGPSVTSALEARLAFKAMRIDMVAELVRSAGFSAPYAAAPSSTISLLAAALLFAAEHGPGRRFVMAWAARQSRREFVPTPINHQTDLDCGRFLHRTKADLHVGELLTAGLTSNYTDGLVMNRINFTALSKGATHPA